MAEWDERSSKRRKLSVPPTQQPLDIKGAFELHDRLRFRQGLPPEVRSGINDFKSFLINISQNEDQSERQIQLKVLKQYCDDQSSSSRDQVDFPDLVSTWSLAAQSNVDALLSAVPGVLATFLRTISAEIGFREFGLSLCHTLLKRDQLRLLERGLSAPKSKGHLISPCLRLLTEITSFDGGALAGNIFARRDALFDRLDILLEPGPGSRDPVDPHRPTVRRMAQRFLIALLKYFDPGSKAEVLGQGKTLYSCIRHLSADGEDIVLELLHTIRKDVVDGDLPRHIKTRVLNSGNLSLLANLYAFEAEGSEYVEDYTKTKSPREAIHELLVYICTNQNGIILPRSGWYPPGLDPGYVEENDDSTIDLGLDSPYYFDDHTSGVPVKNLTLSTFIQTLKPERDTLQAQLLTEIFSKAPELVADYFSKKQKFSTPPRDDPIWRGHVAFMFSVVQLPVPSNLGFGDKLPASPPPLSVVIESILPRPFDQSTISRCFNMNEDIMTISAARLLTVALEKLNAVVEIFRSASRSSDLWHQAISKLTDHFIQRIPALKDVITTLQRTSKENKLVRGVILECVAMYHKILPSATVGSRFDITPALNETLAQLDQDDINAEERDTLLSQLSHIVTIANLSNASKWWHKSDSQSLSPFVALLRFCAASGTGEARCNVSLILRSILTDKGVLHFEGRPFDALLASLNSTKKWSPALETYIFLDNCISRSMKQPVKYLDQLEAAQQLFSKEKSVSLLACCITEQWPFVLKKDESKVTQNIAEWIARLFTALDVAGENNRVMMHFEQQMAQQADGKSRTAFEKAFEKQQKKPVVLVDIPTSTNPEEKEDVDMNDTSSNQMTSLDLDEMFGKPATGASSFQGLDRWDKADFESELNHQENRLFQLVQCISSPDDEIRRQAYQTTQSVMHYVDVSSYAEKQQVHLLLGEVCETARLFGLDKPIPSITTELAVLLLRIISDPSDQMYIKANQFLMRGPSWDVSRLIPYWVDKILLSEPEADDGHRLEVERLMDVLVNGLRNAADMEVYRKSNVFERVLSLYSSPQCRGLVRKRILQLLYRAIQAGGADTLITRVAIKAWLRMGQGSEHREIMDSLHARVEDDCTKDYIERWEEARPVLKGAT